MNLSELANGIREVRQNRPGLVALVALGFIVFVFLAVDAWQHKRRRKKPR